MTPDERGLIQDLFDRMRGMGRIDKDLDAEALIHRAVNAHPDSLYIMVQTVLVQENALAQSEQRMRELEEQVERLSPRQPQAQASGGGSFLGGLFGGSKAAEAPPRGGSVPSYGAAPAGGSPWGNQGGGQAGGYQQGGYQPAPQPVQQAAPARSGGGFLGSAMTTAAGVAGGMLAANAISGMMGGGNHGGGLFGGGAKNDAARHDPAPTPQANTQTAASEELTDEDYDIDTTDDSGGDVGGDDSMDV